MVRRRDDGLRAAAGWRDVDAVEVIRRAVALGCHAAVGRGDRHDPAERVVALSRDVGLGLERRVRSPVQFGVAR